MIIINMFIIVNKNGFLQEKIKSIRIIKNGKSNT